VQRSGFNSVHLVTSGSPITYFFVAPGRKPYSYGGGKPHNGCSPSGARGPRGPRGTRCEGPARRGRRGDAGEVRGKRQGA
jgi:hypothetical protein